MSTPTSTRNWEDETVTMRVCDTCAGRGEVALRGTYGPTTSPENLVLVNCPDCAGEGEVPA